MARLNRQVGQPKKIMLTACQYYSTRDGNAHSNQKKTSPDTLSALLNTDCPINQSLQPVEYKVTHNIAGDKSPTARSISHCNWLAEDSSLRRQAEITDCPINQSLQRYPQIPFPFKAISHVLRAVVFPRFRSWQFPCICALWHWTARVATIPSVGTSPTRSTSLHILFEAYLGQSGLR